MVDGGQRDRNYKGEMMAKGRRGEDVVMEWLRSQETVKEVEDVRNVAWAKRHDVDCIVHHVEGKPHLVEIKSDRHIGTSENYNFELARWETDGPASTGHLVGWSVFSVADVLMIYAPTIHEIHRIKMAEFREALHNAFKAQAVGLRLKQTDKTRATINLLIPEEYVTGQPSFIRHKLKA